MSNQSISVRQRTSITITSQTPYQLEHMRWTARYRLSEQLERGGDYDLRRTLFNANLLDALDDWQTKHPYVRPSPVVLPQPASASDADSSIPPPVMVRDFAATAAPLVKAPSQRNAPQLQATVESDDDDFLFTPADSDSDLELDSTISATSLTSDTSSPSSSDDDSDEWDPEYRDDTASQYTFGLLDNSASFLDKMSTLTLDDHDLGVSEQVEEDSMVVRTAALVKAGSQPRIPGLKSRPAWRDTADLQGRR